MYKSIAGKCKAILLVILFISACIFTACEEDDGSGYTFRVNLSSNPQNLDPQLATDSSSMAVIANMFEGLVRITADGSIEPAAAESYSISENERVYTFELKQNITWEGVEDYSANMTADDFVFAFHRIFDEKTAYSPYKEQFMCIKNSRRIMKGEAKLSDLGVIATSKYTLQIELEKPYYSFLQLLTLPAAMPCNEAFFESTKGRYGLCAETTLSNGAFYLKEWNYDAYWDNNYLIMRRNKANSSNDYVYPYSLNFFIVDEKTDNKDSFSSQSIDCYVAENYDKKIFEENVTSSYSTKSYGLIFNVKSEYFADKDMRTALAASVNREMISCGDTGELSVAYGVVPPAVMLLGKSYRDIIPDAALSLCDMRTAARLWKKKLTEMNAVSVDGIKITVPEKFTGSDVLSSVTEQWQQNLEFYCGIEVVSQNEYNLKLSEKSYDIILIELSSDFNSPDNFLGYFIEADNPTNGYSNVLLNSTLFQLEAAENMSEAVKLYTDAEKYIIDDAVYIPLFYGNDYFVYRDNMKDLIFCPFSNQMDFRYSKAF